MYKEEKVIATASFRFFFQAKATYENGMLTNENTGNSKGIKSKSTREILENGELLMVSTFCITIVDYINVSGY